MSKAEPETKTSKETEPEESENEAISNVHRELAVKATECFEKGEFNESLSFLSKLREQRPLDIRFTLNAAVVEFYKNGFHKVEEFKNKFNSVCSLGEIKPDNIESLDDVRNCYFYFNKAVLLFHSMQYGSALRILNKVFLFAESMDFDLKQAVALLLIELFLCVRQPDRAISVITVMENTRSLDSEERNSENSDENDTTLVHEDNIEQNISDPQLETFKKKLEFYKCISCFMLHKFDACGKEFENLTYNMNKVVVKNGYISDKLYEARCFNMRCSFKFLQSYSEFLRGSLKSCVQIMSTIPFKNNFNLTGDSVTLAFYNNMGCAHLAMGKPNLASLYFRKALLENKNNKKANSNENESANKVLFTHGGNKLPELMYNLGISLLHCGKPVEAFDCLTLAVQFYHMNPRLWLRLAECCIMVHKNGNERDFDFINKRKEVLEEVIGNGIHRKLILNLNLFENNKYSYDAQSFAIPVASLEFATLCLRNSLMLLSSHLSDFSPSNPMNSIQVANLRTSVQVASAYVSLCLGDPKVTLNNCKEVIALGKGVNKLLGHLYIAEAYVLLDRISEALEHLRPSVVDFFFPPDGDESEKTERPWKPDNSASTKAVFQYNMAVVLALNGELQKAAELLKQVWLTKGPQCEIPVQIISLALYIELSLGHADIARNIIKQNCPQFNTTSVTS